MGEKSFKIKRPCLWEELSEEKKSELRFFVRVIIRGEDVHDAGEIIAKAIWEGEL